MAGPLVGIFPPTVPTPTPLAPMVRAASGSSFFIAVLVGGENNELLLPDTSEVRKDTFDYMTKCIYVFVCMCVCLFYTIIIQIF